LRIDAVTFETIDNLGCPALGGLRCHLDFLVSCAFCDNRSGGAVAQDANVPENRESKREAIRGVIPL
jgi:hypothetical protein